MTKLSVNVNKIAWLRNARGGNLPDLVKMSQDCELFGAQGITVHPRPDERHIKYSDVPLLKEIVTTEYNIEGYPNPNFMKLVMDNLPNQCTLVPDPPNVLTSNTGWDTLKNDSFLKEIISELQSHNIRVSLFVNPENEMIEGAKRVGADRIELYTGDYANQFHRNKEQAIAPFINAANFANNIGIGINAGHDLNLDNLKFFKQNIIGLQEVSIGHALISDALYFGLRSTIQMYLQCLV